MTTTDTHVIRYPLPKGLQRNLFIRHLVGNCIVTASRKTFGARYTQLPCRDQGGTDTQFCSLPLVQLVGERIVTTHCPVPTWWFHEQFCCVLEAFTLHHSLTAEKHVCLHDSRLILTPYFLTTDQFVQYFVTMLLYICYNPLVKKFVDCLHGSRLILTPCFSHDKFNCTTLCYIQYATIPTRWWFYFTHFLIEISRLPVGETI